MNCYVCGGHIPALSGTKIEHGTVCKNCAAKIPSLIFKHNPYVSDCALRVAIDYAKEKTEKFEATASYID